MEPVSVSEKVSELTQLADGTFDATLENIRINARTVLLATGVIDKEPRFLIFPTGSRKALSATAAFATDTK